jgi:4,5-dihydroxyphthalate decarboxylase
VSLPLRIAFSENPMVRPLKDGRVKPNNIELDFITVDHPGDLFYRNLKFDEFDVSEMGIPWTIRAMEMNDKKKWDWAKLPIFLSRGTGWTNLYVNTASGIRTLQDLNGKKICVPEYNTSMCMWLRVILKDFFGIRPEDNVWYLARTKDRNQGGMLGVADDRPEGVRAFWLTEEQMPDGILERGEIDAAIIHPGSFGPHSIDRYSGASLFDNPRIRKLFPDDGRSLIDEFTEKARVYQINHHVIVQNRILKENPWVAMELFRAFQRSKDIALEDTKQRPSITLQSDDFPLGIKAMRKSFDRYIQAMLDGHLIERRFQVEDVYYPTTLET